MLKFIIISFLVFFIIYKLLGFVFKMLIRNSINHHQQQQRQAYYSQNKDRSGTKPTDGNVNIDYIPRKEKQKNDKNDFNGGEYIDYEEVK